MIKEFDLNTVILEGSNLIEAGAGTGKTYSIAGLYIRLLLEKNLTVDQILVVTFTIAATEELKSRIRRKINDTIAALENGNSDDITLAELAGRIADRKAAVEVLVNALRQFDEAAIHTIHGFCRKMLHDYAFESRNLFSAEFTADQLPFLSRAVNDFWRTRITTQSAIFISYLNDREKDKIDSPDKLMKILSNHYSKPYLEIIPRLKIQKSAGAESDLQLAFDNLKKDWSTVRGEIADLLLNHDSLNRTRYKKDSIQAWILQMDNLLLSDYCNPALFDNFRKFTTGYLNSSLKKNGRPIEHAFFDLCEKLYALRDKVVEIYDHNIVALKAELFQYVAEELKKIKRSNNVQHYDDLLDDMQKALRSSIGGYLAKAIRSRYPAALIDEFQDTDPIQYDIFRTIYTGREGILFLIGDPKQAIYSFRGADIFAYIDSISRVDNHYTLSTNWRSQPDLIGAVNRIFVKAVRPFVFEQIPFLPARPADREKRDRLRIKGVELPPFQLWFFDSRKFGEHQKYKGFINKEAARDLMAGSVTGEIVELLNRALKNEITIGPNPLGAGDIAVLVRTNEEAAIVKDYLAKANIPSVLYSDKSVFQSEEAAQLYEILNAIANYGEEGYVRAALAADIIGLPGNEIYGLNNDDIKWNEWLTVFRDYLHLWENRGFINMFRAFLVRQSVRSRLLTLPDGERRLTNILHLGELLHRQSMESRLNIPRLVRWLAMQINDSDSVQDDHQLRLESDETAVRIITIHKSKGLEYPIVFCPFTWGGSRLGRDRDFLFHDPDNGYKPTLDLGSGDREPHRYQAEMETLAENLRLFYVALTRARNRCYLAWGLFNQSGSSALSYLFHQPTVSDHANILDDIELNFGGLSDDRAIEALAVLTDGSDQAMKLEIMPSEAPAKYKGKPEPPGILQARTFTGGIDKEWRISSFSSLTSRKIPVADIPDYDIYPRADEIDKLRPGPVSQTEPASGIFAFPGGARAGTFCHDLFEHLDFASTDETYLTDLIEAKLRAFGYDQIWHKTIMTMVRNALNKSLPAGKSRFELAGIPCEARLNELEFYFPLKKITPETLSGVFAGHRVAGIKNPGAAYGERLDFNPARGFMKGYIDLVLRHGDKYYLIDWKSNHLGNDHRDYSRERMSESMVDNQYFLQYHIYVLALHRYLSMRMSNYDYERHFGGVYYLFLRGIESEIADENGVFFDRPAASLIDDLNGLLIPGI